MIVTNVGGNPEAVLHERTGLVVPPHDPRAIGEAILRLSRDPNLRTSSAQPAGAALSRNTRLIAAWRPIAIFTMSYLPGAGRNNLLQASGRTVLHVISGLDMGGAERMLTRVVLSNRRPESPRHIVISLTDEGYFGSQTPRGRD